MTFDWLNFLHLGDFLFTSGKAHPEDESKLRTSIGRMYYAVFGTTRDYYEEVKKVRFFNTHEDHDILWREIENEKGGRVANNFNRMRRTRNDADYKSSFPGDIVNTAELQTRRAREILSKHGLLPH